MRLIAASNSVGLKYQDPVRPAAMTFLPSRFDRRIWFKSRTGTLLLNVKDYK
ncbi:hypothetical protein HY36_12795 [Hyphomonas atlantica]|uniref:Uncharacterized protein n=1 Tax=Hyphomonas atlantica TaxID=1280948 RepID=A0A059EAC7_9PROT|nr:hypothetical protein HY36_12795 [Hyphomonas atlantica]